MPWTKIVLGDINAGNVSLYKSARRIRMKRARDCWRSNPLLSQKLTLNMGIRICCLCTFNRVFNSSRTRWTSSVFVENAKGHMGLSRFPQGLSMTFEAARLCIQDIVGINIAASSSIEKFRLSVICSHRPRVSRGWWYYDTRYFFLSWLPGAWSMHFSAIPYHSVHHPVESWP
jgi:hypothetical protein